jgi:hypothetical protein
MKVTGVIKNKATEEPVPQARVVLAFGEKELAVLYSNDSGEVQHNEGAEYLGKTLTCHVEKEGFEPQEKSFSVEHEVLAYEIALVPLRAEPVQHKKDTEPKESTDSGKLKQPEKHLEVTVKDKTGKPLAGVSVTCKMPDGNSATGVSDDNGIAVIALAQEEPREAKGQRQT